MFLLNIFGVTLLYHDQTWDRKLYTGGESGMIAYTCATRKGVFFWQTGSDAFRGPKSPYFRNKGVLNSSLVVIRVMFINNVTFIKIILV